MKKIAQIVLLVLLSNSIFAQYPANTINAVIGDESFLAIFGVQPPAGTDEQLRIQTHLFYVENKLRSKGVEGLSEQQQLNRAKVLDLLRDYYTKGVFPTNAAYLDNRRPCFIDNDGNICAVGYLIAQTSGLEVAQAINAAHQYDYLLDMHSPVIDAWAAENGLTVEECAMIQPSYSPVPPVSNDGIRHMPINTGYGITSGLVGGVNIAVTTMSMGRFGSIKGLSYIGLVSGLSQVVMGLTNLRRDVGEGSFAYDGVPTSYKAQRNLSYINIAVGTTAMVTSTINLLLHKKLNSHKNTFGLYSYPGIDNKLNLGFTLARKL